MVEDRHIFAEGPFPNLVYVITTVFKDVVNACPVTWCTPCSYNPPAFMVAIKRGKDTFANILDSHEFVLQTVPAKNYQEVHNLAKTLEADESELHIDNLKTRDSLFLYTPRLEIAVNWYECETDVDMINSYGTTHFQVIGKVVSSGHNYQATEPLLYQGERIYTKAENRFEATPYY